MFRPFSNRNFFRKRDQLLTPWRQLQELFCFIAVVVDPIWKLLASLAAVVRCVKLLPEKVFSRPVSEQVLCKTRTTALRKVWKRFLYKSLIKGKHARQIIRVWKQSCHRVAVKMSSGVILLLWLTTAWGDKERTQDSKILVEAHALWWCPEKIIWNSNLHGPGRAVLLDFVSKIKKGLSIWHRNSTCISTGSSENIHKVHQ